METKKKVFDAVAESRKWRETTSRKLDAMPRISGWLICVASVNVAAPKSAAVGK